MKTYKQMAERVLKRRDEYDERKAERKAKRPVVSAAVAAAVMVVVILFGTVMGGVLKAPVSAPGADTPTDDNPVLINNETSETAETAETAETGETLPDETTEDVTETGREPDTVNDTQPGQQAEDGYPVPIEFIPDPDTPIFIDVKNNPDIYGTECKDVIRYQMRYNTRRDFGRECGNRVRLLIVASSSIQLLSPDVMTLDISENDSVDFELVFRYVEGNSRGAVNIFSVEDLYWDIDNNYQSAEELTELVKDKDFNMIFTGRKFCVVRTKGYDFIQRGEATTYMYYSIAEYFGDVDDEGYPLFLNDPYMPDYYDCDQCQDLRQQIEEREKFNRKHSVITN